MDRFELFTVLIAKISRSIKRLKAEEMAEFQLKGPHVSCLYYLAACGPLTAAQLCERCDEDKAAISRSLDHLEKNGYIVCDHAGRHYKALLRLTDKGQAVCRTLREKVDRIVSAASQGLCDEDRQTMYRALTLISGHLEELYRNRKYESKQPAAPGGCEQKENIT